MKVARADVGDVESKLIDRRGARHDDEELAGA